MTAVSCGTPTPATMRVVQIEPGPIPTFTASAPESISAFVAYQVSPSWQLVGGWRELDVDRGDLDYRLSGPLLGAKYRF